jgi:hypothetical protein
MRSKWVVLIYYMIELVTYFPLGFKIRLKQQIPNDKFQINSKCQSIKRIMIHLHLLYLFGI